MVGNGWQEITLTHSQHVLLSCIWRVKAAVSMENNETSVADHYRPYPDCLCCYCIQILLTEPLFVLRKDPTQQLEMAHM